MQYNHFLMKCQYCILIIVKYYYVLMNFAIFDLAISLSNSVSYLEPLLSFRTTEEEESPEDVVFAQGISPCGTNDNYL